MYQSPLKTTPAASRLGFGLMRLPKREDGSIDRETALEMVDYAWNNGVTYFDTAYQYHAGESELFAGEALSRYPRESYLLADKLPIWVCETLEDCERVFAEQLEKCRTDYFDFYLLHAINKKRWKKIRDMGLPELMDRYRKEGKIRKFGFSYHGGADAFCEIAEDFNWDFAQIQINYVDDRLLDARALYQKLCELNLPAVIMEPIRGGSLAAVPKEMQQLMAQVDTPWSTPAQWALRWCLGFDNMQVILSGMTTLEQVRENVALFSSAPPLSAEEHGILEQVRDYYLSLKTVPCTACGYCACPSGVYIPEIFSHYNKHTLFPNDMRFRMDYANLTEAHHFKACTGCRACVALCPQGIDIPGELERIHQVAAAITIKVHEDTPPVA